MIDDTAVDTRVPAVDDALAVTRDSIAVALWTAISRVTGLVRVGVIAAVLGPTYFGNTYQFANSVPNLVYYGLLGGALVSSLLVPVLVRHAAAGRPEQAAAVSRGFLGCATAAATVAVPVLIVAVPLILRTTNGGSHRLAQAQTAASLWLVVLLAPQIVCYAVIACSVAVMNAHRRFAIGAAAPTIENLGCLAVLGAVWVVYGAGREVSDVSGGEIALLGLGTTGAVVLHAAVQWAGARRCGVTLVPQAGWRDAEVRAVAASSGYAVGQAGLWAVQLVVASALANRLPGGVVAVLIASNFFFLPLALGATPIALAAQPRLAALVTERRHREYDAAVTRNVSLAVFVTVPAAVGFLVLAPALERVISFGSMAAARGHGLIAPALAALAPGVVGTGVFTVLTYACYARSDARAPLRAMTVQALVAVPIMLSSLACHGRAAMVPLMGGLAAGGFVGAGVLLARHHGGRAGAVGIARAARRSVGCALVMAPAVWLCVRAVGDALPSRAGQGLAVALAVLTGGAAYVLAQHLVQSPELSLLTGSVGRRPRRPARPEPGRPS